MQEDKVKIKFLENNSRPLVFKMEKSRNCNELREELKKRKNIKEIN